jgi:hypothetical protein
MDVQQCVHTVRIVVTNDYCIPPNVAHTFGAEGNCDVHEITDSKEV